MTLQACTCATSLPLFSDPSYSWRDRLREPGAPATTLPPCDHQLLWVRSIPSGIEVRSSAIEDAWHRRLSASAVAGNESPECIVPAKMLFSDASQTGRRLRRNRFCSRIRSAALPILHAECGRELLDSQSCSH